MQVPSAVRSGEGNHGNMAPLLKASNTIARLRCKFEGTWQLWCVADRCYIPEFGRVKYVHVSIDTFSGAVYASAHTGEKATDTQKHLLEAFSMLGNPKGIKRDNNPTHTSKAFRELLQQWGVEHQKGILYSPTSQAIIERPHQALKRTLEQQWDVLSTCHS